MKTLEIDIETYSGTDLASSGVCRYAGSPDFEILLFGYSIDNGPVHVVDLACGEKIPKEIDDSLSDDTVIKFAHNSTFERICLSRFLGYPDGRYLDPKSWRCTMVWSAYMGLPLSLKDVGSVLGLGSQKMKEGKELIRYFCMPCKPTKANGGRTRNLPSHDPDNWERFKEYNARDVEVEMAIREKLRNYPMPEAEWNNYVLDQRINDRGIMLDMKLVRQALMFEERSGQELKERMRELTELENPNSVVQMKEWLLKNGVETESLDKAAVRELLKSAPGKLKEVLHIRQDMAKTSIRKYTAMENAVCSDERARGLIQFYGANRTGRFSGRLIQVQNLSQNHMEDLEQARELIRNGNYDAVSMLYDSIPEVLSELIRTAFISKPGYKFIVADFSAIEARVIAWLAGETWKMDVFKGDGKVYEATAARMFNVPIESVTKGSPLRQKAKQTELACIAEGEMVLTHKGLVPIENVTKEHLLWDGESWVVHEGVIYKGIREVIEYEGLCATPDHLVWIEGKQKPVPFGEAAASCSHLVQTGHCWEALRLDHSYKFRKTMEQSNEPLLCSHQMQWLRICPVAEFRCFASWKIKRMPRLFATQTTAHMAGKKAFCGKTEVRESERFRIPQLWWQGDKIRIPVNTGSWFVDYGEYTKCITGPGTRSNRYQQKLRTWKPQICFTNRQSKKQKRCSFNSLGTKILALFTKRRDKEAVTGIGPRNCYSECRRGCCKKMEKLEANRSPVRVYDIRNAGKHHRFTVSGKLVHNCGYGGSVGALKAMGALDMGLAEEELKPLVTAWRNANPNIVSLWWGVDRAVKKAVKEMTTTEVKGIRFEYQSGMLFIRLPSGRKLSYVKPRIGENRFGGECVTYEGTGTARKWERIESYGPKFVENIVQAISRDLLCHAMNTLDSKGYEIVMHVHDEVVLEVSPEVSVEKICDLMSYTTDWANGLFLRAEGFECSFYKKD